jgi:flagellar protein FliT
MPPDDGSRVTTDRGSMIQHYEAIAAASRRMLDAARAGDWDAVGQEEDHCRALISTLKRSHPEAAVASAARRQRMALLRAMLADDAEIRELSEPWLKQLEALLAGRSTATRTNA